MAKCCVVRYISLAALVSLSVSHNAWASSKIDLDVLYLGVMDDSRTADFHNFLSERFTRVETMDRDDFLAKASTLEADVVLLDWHQGESAFPSDSSFLGAWGELKIPAVLLGSAGLLHSVATEVRGGFG